MLIDTQLEQTNPIGDLGFFSRSFLKMGAKGWEEIATNSKITVE